MRAYLIIIFNLCIFNSLLAQENLEVSESSFAMTTYVHLYEQNKAIDSLFNIEINRKLIDSHYFVFRTIKTFKSYDYQVYQLEEDRIGLSFKNPDGSTNSSLWGYLFYKGYIILLTGDKPISNSFFKEIKYVRPFTFSKREITSELVRNRPLGLTRKFAHTYLFLNGQFVGGIKPIH